MATNLDVRFEEALAKDTSLPAFLVDPTRSLENSGAVQNRLASLRPASRFAARQREASATPVAPTESGVAIPGVQTPSLPTSGTAPEFTDNQRWFNTPGGKPLTLAGLRGHVVLVDFWTYTCINCIRTLPFLKGLYATYHRYGLEIVGVETPEFTFEQEAGNVQQAIHSDGLRYPVVQDNRYGTWNAYQNEYWPAEYLIDAHGQVRHTQFGEGDYKQDEAAVRALLYDAGARHLPPPMTAHAIIPSGGLATPETYLDYQRAQGFAQPLQRACTSTPGCSTRRSTEFGLHGTWNVTKQSATPVSAGATITGRFQAQHVYLVMTSAGNVPRTVRVLLDGHPISGGRLRRRRPRRPGDGLRAAAVRADLAARRPAAHVHAAGAAGGQRLRLHVRDTHGCEACSRPRADGSSTPSPLRPRIIPMEGSTEVRSWLRCYRCWSQNLEVQVHYEGIHRIDPETGERGEVVDEMQEAVVQCLECMHDQPHLGFHNGRVEPIEDRWERMIAGTPWVASCTVTVDADDVETCSGPRPATPSPTPPSATTERGSSSPTSASTSTTRTGSSCTCWWSCTRDRPRRRPRCSRRPPAGSWRSPRWPRNHVPRRRPETISTDAGRARRRRHTVHASPKISASATGTVAGSSLSTKNSRSNRPASPSVSSAGQP